MGAFQDEDEVDQGTMVRAGTGDSGTIRAAGSLSSTARTMIEHDTDTGTMQSQLGTMVINSDDEDEEEAGTMKSKNTFQFIRAGEKKSSKKYSNVQKC